VSGAVIDDAPTASHSRPERMDDAPTHTHLHEHDHTTLARVDRIGAVVSIACAVHCLAAPFVLLAFASVGGLDEAHDTLHALLVLGSILLGMFSFGRGYRQHGQARVIVLLVPATVLLLLGQFSAEGVLETTLTVAGALLLATGHWLNYRWCDACASGIGHAKAVAKAEPLVRERCNHRISRRPLAWAVIMNAVVLAVETFGSFASNSVSLLADAAHNLADECGLICLLIAYSMSIEEARNWRRGAMVLNVAGALMLSGWIVWESFERWSVPVAVDSPILIACGIFAALGNMAVATVLRSTARNDSAVQVAFLHNVGDAIISTIPVAAGILVATTGYDNIDSVVGLAVAAVVVAGTMRALWLQRNAPRLSCVVCETAEHGVAHEHGAH